MINVSKRIESIVNTIEFDTLVDIATDHGFIPIYAVLNKKVKMAIASDLNKEPLISCDKNIKKYNLEENIQTVLSNGLENIQTDYKTMTLGGIGGLLMCDIISKDMDKTKNFSQLVLQPQSDYKEVRKKIYELGFYIKEEIYLIDNLSKKNNTDKYYIIFNCIKGQKDMPLDKELSVGINISPSCIDIYENYIDIVYNKAKLDLNNLTKNAKTDTTYKEKYYNNLINYLEGTKNEIRKDN